MRGAVAILAGVLHVHGDAGQIFHHDFAGEAGIAAGAARGDDDFLEGEESFFDGLQRIRKDHVVRDVLANGFANGLRLLINFPQHPVGKGARGAPIRILRLASHPSPPPPESNLCRVTPYSTNFHNDACPAGARRARPDNST